MTRMVSWEEIRFSWTIPAGQGSRLEDAKRLTQLGWLASLGTPWKVYTYHPLKAAFIFMDVA